MAAKLREKDGSYWVVVHHEGRRKWKKIGKDKREALKVVHKVNAQLALGKFSMEPAQRVPTVEEALERWYEDYKPTFSPSYAQLIELTIRCHLVPAFGPLRLSELEEGQILRFIAEATVGAEGKRPKKAATLRSILAILRRALTVAVERGEIPQNPCRHLGRLLAKVKRQQSQEVEHVNAWSREEVATLLDVARAEEPDFYPLIGFLLSTGCRRGEALGLKWEDVDFTRKSILIRRALVRGQLGTPKSGRARSVVLSPALAQILRELLSERQRASLAGRWPEVPDFVFCTGKGGFLDEQNVGRSWRRLRRKAEAEGVRPLRLHDARHTFASLALAAGKSVRWVASQLGHSDPALTLRVYAHAMREEESDLSFLDFGGTKRHPRGTPARSARARQRAPVAKARRGTEKLVELRGIEPLTLRLPA